MKLQLLYASYFSQKNKAPWGIFHERRLRHNNRMCSTIRMGFRQRVTNQMQGQLEAIITRQVITTM